MSTIGAQEFRRDIHRIVREVREQGAIYDITYYGKLIARLEPVARPARELEMSSEQWLQEWDALTDEISEAQPEDCRR